MKRLTMLVLVLLYAHPARGQESTSYRLTEHVFNAGGHPGTSLASASYRLTLDAIGDGLQGTGLASDSFRMDAGFVPAYGPAAEVRSVRFVDATSLVWDPDGSVGYYNIYRGLVTTLSTLGYGACWQPGVTGEAASDGDVPPAADGFFYHVTAVSRLREEGTLGAGSGGVERPNVSPCP